MSTFKKTTLKKIAPKKTKFEKTALTWLAIGGGAFLLYYLVKNEIAKAANAVNPLNPNNVFNTGTNDLYQAITGSQGTIGTDLYNLTHANLGSGVVNPTYFVYNQKGQLQYDYNGNPITTSYPPGTPQNPYPNPNT